MNQPVKYPEIGWVLGEGEGDIGEGPPSTVESLPMKNKPLFQTGDIIKLNPNNQHKEYFQNTGPELILEILDHRTVYRYVMLNLETGKKERMITWYVDNNYEPLT